MALRTDIRTRLTVGVEDMVNLISAAKTRVHKRELELKQARG